MGIMEHNPAAPEAHEASASAPSANGSNHQQQEQTPPNPTSTDEARARAEEMVDRWANNISAFTSVWGRRIYRAAARVREEAQDFWAEAQSIRKGDQH
jgi:hypothetical protein